MVTINETDYSFVIDVEFSQIKNVMLPEYINITGPDVDIDTNVWNQGVKRITYTMRVTDVEKWVLDQLLTGHIPINLTDSTYGLNNNVWVAGITADYQRNMNDIYRWLITIELIIII